MGKMILTMIATSAAISIAMPLTAGAEAAKAKPAKQGQAKATCDKCKNAKKACVCEEDEKHGDHDHEEGNHDHKDEKKAK